MPYLKLKDTYAKNTTRSLYADLRSRCSQKRTRSPCQDGWQLVALTTEIVRRHVMPHSTSCKHYPKNMTRAALRVATGLTYQSVVPLVQLVHHLLCKFRAHGHVVSLFLVYFHILFKTTLIEFRWLVSRAVPVKSRGRGIQVGIHRYPPTTLGQAQLLCFSLVEILRKRYAPEKSPATFSQFFSRLQLETWNPN